MVVAGAAKRYAEAAFGLAKDQGKLDEWEQALDRLRAVMSDPTVAEFFENPAVPDQAKRSALEQVLPGEASKQVRNLALLLLERGRLHQVADVVAHFKDLVLEDRGVAIAEVTTAVELAPGEVKTIRDRLQRLIGKEIQLQPRIDPGIIGGIVVRVGDTLIDGSVRTQLATLRQRLAQ